MRLRVYAVTRRNNLIAGLLFLLVCGQLFFGIAFTVRVGKKPRKFFGRSFVRVRTDPVASSTDARDKLGRVQGLPSRTVDTWRIFGH